MKADDVNTFNVCFDGIIFLHSITVSPSPDFLSSHFYCVRIFLFYSIRRSTSWIGCDDALSLCVDTVLMMKRQQYD